MWNDKRPTRLRSITKPFSPEDMLALANDSGFLLRDHDADPGP